MTDETFSPEAPEPTPAADPVVDSPWAPPQDEWNQIRNFVGAAAPVLGQLAQAMQDRGTSSPLAPEPAPAAPAPAFDPWEPSSVQNYIAAQVEQGVRSQLEAYEPLLETVASTEGERQARAMLTSLADEVGGFDEDAAMILAAGLMSHGNVMPDHALRSSAQYLHELEARVREDERNRVIEEQRQLTGAPAEHPVAGTPAAAAMETVPTGARRYDEAVGRWLARRNASLPVG